MPVKLDESSFMFLSEYLIHWIWNLNLVASALVSIYKNLLKPRELRKLLFLYFIPALL